MFEISSPLNALSFTGKEAETQVNIVKCPMSANYWKSLT